MPVTDGLRLIEELRKRNCDALPVILSGYQDFDYAKRAVRLDVVDYLLKPLHPETLTTLLQELREKVENRKKKRQQDVLESIIRNRVDATLSARDIEQLFSSYRGYACLYICAGASCTYATSSPFPAAERWSRMDLGAEIPKHLIDDERCWIVDVDSPNERLIAIGSATGQVSRAFDLASHIHHSLDRRVSPLSTVADFFQGNPMEMSPFIQGMRGVLNRASVFGKSTFLRRDDAAAVAHAASHPLAPYDEKVLRVLIHNRLKSQLKLEVKKILDACEAQHCTHYMLERELRRLCALLYDFGRETSAPEERIASLLIEAADYADVFDGFCRLIDEVFSQAPHGEASDDSIGETMKRIDRHLLSHFMRPLSLESVARLFGMTQSYLSSMYKRIMGMTPLKRITELRMNKAKELLSIQPRIAIKEISDAVGYDDPYYFSRVFRTFVGRSPSQYREVTHRPGDRTVPR